MNSQYQDLLALRAIEDEIARALVVHDLTNNLVTLKVHQCASNARRALGGHKVEVTVMVNGKPIHLEADMADADEIRSRMILTPSAATPAYKADVKFRLRGDLVDRLLGEITKQFRKALEAAFIDLPWSISDGLHFNPLDTTTTETDK